MKHNASIAMIHSGMTAPIIEALGDRGIDADPVLGVAKLQIRDLERAYIPASKAWDFLEAAAEAAGETSLGYQIGSEMPAPRIPNLSVLRPEEITLGERLSKLVVDAQRLTNQATYTLSHDSAVATLKQVRRFKPARHPRQAEGFFTGFVIRLLREAMGEKWQMRQLQISLLDATVLPASIRKGTVVMEERRTGLLFRFPASWLLIGNGGREDRNISLANRPKFKLLDAVREELQSRIADPNLSLDSVSETFGISSRSLQSELASRGASFRNELAKLRRDRATLLLETTDALASEVGACVGLPSLPAFSRSFKKWTGKSPESYRRKYQT